MNGRLTQASGLVQGSCLINAPKVGNDSDNELNERAKTMIRNLLIAVSAAAVLATASASSASAKVHVNLNIGLGVPGFGYGEPYPYPYYPSYPAYPVVHDGYDDGYSDDGGDCGYDWVAYRRWNRWHTAYIIKHHKVWVCY